MAKTVGDHNRLIGKYKAAIDGAKWYLSTLSSIMVIIGFFKYLDFSLLVNILIIIFMLIFGFFAVWFYLKYIFGNAAEYGTLRNKTIMDMKRKIDRIEEKFPRHFYQADKTKHE